MPLACTTRAVQTVHPVRPFSFPPHTNDMAGVLKLKNCVQHPMIDTNDEFFMARANFCVQRYLDKGEKVLHINADLIDWCLLCPADPAVTEMQYFWMCIHPTQWARHSAHSVKGSAWRKMSTACITMAAASKADQLWHTTALLMPDTLPSFWHPQAAAGFISGNANV